MNLRLWAMPVALVLLGACGRKAGDPEAAPSSGSPPPAKVTLQCMVGSENKDLKPILDQFGQDNGVELVIAYKGSVDGMLELQKGPATQFDIVWLASDLWLNLGDRQKVVKNAESMMTSPVVFGVKTAKAKELGWHNNATVKIKDILEAVEAHKLRFAMTSATQSNTGASALFSFYSAMAGSPEVLTAQHLDDPNVQEQTKKLTTGVNRLFGSSGYLADDLVKSPEKYDCMVNYEALVISANKKLVAAGEDPLYAVFPADGVVLANFPMGFVNHGDTAKEQAFKRLQAYLKSEPVQRQILALGRRTQILGLNPDAADKSVFNPQWGTDAARKFGSIAMPSADVIAKGLDLYQTALRKPSFSLFVLDYSGSMNHNGGTEQRNEAMNLLLEPERAKRYMLQFSPRDFTAIFPYDNKLYGPFVVQGNDPVQLRTVLAQITDGSIGGGGTSTHGALAAVFDYLMQNKDKLQGYTPAIFLMTDGDATDDIAVFQEKVQQLGVGRDIPIYAITFGSQVDAAKIATIVNLTSGKVFDGAKDLVSTFREVKGYN